MLNSQKKLDNYMLYGAYHWYWYNTRFTYTRHVGLLENWVQEKNTLQVGAGDGLIASRLGIRGIDNNRYAVDLAKIKGAKVDLGDATRLPYRNKQFDSVLMADVLEYIKDTKKALSEARRVAKKYLYITIPIGKRHIEADYVHFWKPDKLIALVEKQGFKLLSPPKHSLSRVRVYMKFEKV